MWYSDLSLTKQFGEALSNAEYFEDSSEFAGFLRKPQRYNEAYAIWETAGFPIDDSDDGWDDFVDSITDNTNEDNDADSDG